MGYTHEKSNCPVSNTFMPLSALSTMSLPSVQTVIEFTNWIPKIMVQFCYLRLYFGIDNVSRRLLQWIARIKNGLKLRPTTRYRTYSNQIKVQDWFRSDYESAEEGDFEVVYGRIGHTWPCRKDQYEIMTGTSGSMRLVSHWWLYDVYFQLLLNCTSGRVHVNSYLDFIRAYPQKWLTCWRKKNSGYHGIIRCRKVKVNS